MNANFQRRLRLAPGRPIGTRDSDRRHCQPPYLSGLEPPTQHYLPGLEPPTQHYLPGLESSAQAGLETDEALDFWGDLFCKYRLGEQFDISFGYFMTLAVEARRDYLRAALRLIKP